MRKLIWGLLAVALGAAALFPVIYLSYARDLPDLGTAAAVRTALARRIESERMATSTIGARYEIAKFEVLPRSRLSKGIVAGLLAAEACPEYFEETKEEGWPRIRRVLSRVHSAGGGAPGPGRCQMRFADLIAEAVGIADPLHAAIADHRILAALSLDELLTYRLASTFYGTGVVGVREASLALFKKEPDQLDTAQSAELIAAESYFPSFSICKNPSRLKLLRDAVIDRMEAFNTIDAADAKRAKKRPVTCATRP